MRETLLLQIPLSREQPYRWRRLSPTPDGPATQEGSGDLNALSTEYPDARLVGLAPSEAITLTSLDLPLRQSSKLLQAAPYALEDRIAEDVDDCHFALGERDEEGRHSVAVVNQSQMDTWLEPIHEAGLSLDVLIPDVLCLPWQSEQTVLHVDAQGRCLLRSGAQMGFACPLELISSLLTEEQLQNVCLYREDESPKLPAELGLSQSHAHQALLPLAASQMPLRHRLNLLQGRYAPRRAAAQWMAKLRWPAALAATALILAIVQLVLTTQAKQAQADALYAQAEEYFRQAFPEQSRIVDMRAQARQGLDALRGAGQAGGFLALLNDSASHLAKSKDLQLDSLQFRDGAIYLSLSGSDLQALEVLRASFQQDRRLKLDVQQAQAGTDGVQIRLKVERV